MFDVSRCPVCGSADRGLVCSTPDLLAPGERFFSVVRCEACGVGYVSQGPEPTELKSYYSEEYLAYAAGSSLAARVLTRVLATLLREEIGSTLGLPLLAPEPGSNAMLDAGCGSGALARKMLTRGWRVFALDFTPALTASGPLGEIRFVLGRAGRLPFRDESFDLVVASHVLEHLYDPVGALKEFSRVLRPGARLSIGVPNFDSFPSRAFGRVTYAYLDVPWHLIFFIEGGLCRAMKAAGFSPTKVRTIPSPALLPTSLLKIGVSSKAIEHGWARAFVNGASLPLDILTQREGQGCNIVALGTKG
ncbi:MAG: class I SAM-dependent methyltransferase [Thermoplasmata archaeon]